MTLTKKQWDFPCVLNLNARSLSIEKSDELLAVIRNNQVDITCVSETWFSGHVSNDAVALPGFSCERKDRQKKKAGGVACYIRNSVPYKRLQNLEDDTHEAVWINSRPRHLPRQFSCIAVGCIYHPPDADNTSMHDYLINCIDHILRMHPSCGVILTGDFNQLRDSFLRSHYGFKQMVE